MGLSSIAFNFVNWGATAAEAYMETLRCFECEDPIRTDLAERIFLQNACMDSRLEHTEYAMTEAESMERFHIVTVPRVDTTNIPFCRSHLTDADDFRRTVSYCFITSDFTFSKCGIT